MPPAKHFLVFTKSVCLYRYDILIWKSGSICTKMMYSFRICRGFSEFVCESSMLNVYMKHVIYFWHMLYTCELLMCHDVMIWPHASCVSNSLWTMWIVELTSKYWALLAIIFKLRVVGEGLVSWSLFEEEKHYWTLEIIFEHTCTNFETLK